MDAASAHQQHGSRGMGAILLAIALPCLLAAAWLLGSALWDRHTGQQATGTVVEITGEVPALVVEFDSGGGAMRRVTSAGSDLHRDFAVGDRLRVWFDPARPQQARLDLFVHNWLFPLLLGVFGGFFALPVLFIDDLRPFRRSRPRRLTHGGSRVQAEFDSLRPVLEFHALAGLRRGNLCLEEHDDGRFTLLQDGQPRDPFDALVQRELGLRYVLRAKWTDSRSGIEYFFDSEPLPENPERHLRGRTIPVFIDPQQPSLYRMDLSFLPGALPPTRVVR